MTARRIVGSFAVLLVLGLAACSNDDGLTANQKQGISNFQAGANAICTSSNTSVHAAQAQAKAQFPSGAPTVDEAHSFLVTTLIPIVEKEVGDLHNLGEPTLDRATWDDIRTQLDSGLVQLKSDAQVDPVKTLVTAMNAPQSGPGTSTLDRSMVSFGISECAKS